MDRSRALWRHYWPVDLLAVVFLIVVVIFGGVLAQRASDARHLAHVLDQKTERQRQAICAILATMPRQAPPEIANARRAFARPSHPDACRPLPGATPSPSPVHVDINGKPATIVVNPPAQPESREPSREPSPGPTSRPTRSPRPRPTHSPTPRPSRSPHPTPSPTCILPPPLRCPI